MTDYNYYRETYGGELTEKAFSKALPKAQAYLRGATRGRALPQQKEVDFCLCELCDYFAQDEEDHIYSESVDGFRVTYRNKRKDIPWKTVVIYLGPLGLLYGGEA